MKMSPLIVCAAFWPVLAWSQTCTPTLIARTQFHEGGPNASGIHMRFLGTCPWSVTTNTPWITLEQPRSGVAIASLIERMIPAQYTIPANNTELARQGRIDVQLGDRTFSLLIFQNARSCPITVSPSIRNVPSGGGSAQFTLTSNPAGCHVSSSKPANLPGSWSFDPTEAARYPTIDPGVQASSSFAPLSLNFAFHAGRYEAPITINQPGATGCGALLLPTAAFPGPQGGTNTVSLTLNPACIWNAVSTSPWITIPLPDAGLGSRDIRYTVAENPAVSSRVGGITIAGTTFPVIQAGRGVIPPSEGLRFVPLTPCRVVDTRAAYAGPRTGPFGPPRLTRGSARTIPVPASSTCQIPTNARAYVFNITLDTVEEQTGPVEMLSIWQDDDLPSDVRMLRTSTGGYIANAAIVKAAANGAIRVTSSHDVNLILDITGYFAEEPSGLLYYPVSPCRAVDTRGPLYSSLPPPYGNLRLQARENRTFRLPGSPACQLPAAPAYSMQLTLAPGELTNGNPVAFVTAYPTGVPQPNISTMNSLFGYAVANSAIVPASTNGSIDLFAFDATNVIMDVNGYFAPDDGTGRGLRYYPIRPCRVMDTQDPMFPGGFRGPAMTSSYYRTITIPDAHCYGLPANARAWAINASVAPNAAVPFLSLWPAATPWPNVSQLNAFQGQTVANFGIVPSSESGAVDIRVAGPSSHVTLEVSGYFAR